MSLGTVILLLLVIPAVAGLGVLAVKINRRSSEGTTSVDQRRPLNQAGSVFQETGQPDREQRHQETSQRQFPSGGGGGRAG